MVLKGQFLERSVVVRSGPFSLDALFHRGMREPPCLIASPHPALGGSMVAPVVAELAWALTRAGHATLRFDYRGVGGSQGELGRVAGSLGASGALLELATLEDERADFLAAADQLRASAGKVAPAALAEEAPRPADGGLCAIGYSFGAAVALSAAADPRIASLILIAPPSLLFNFSSLTRLQKPVLVLCAHHDPLCDRTALTRSLGPHATLEVIAHADQSFRRGLTEVGRAAAAFLRAPGEPQVAAPERVDEPGEVMLAELELPEGDGEPLELDE